LAVENALKTAFDWKTRKNWQKNIDKEQMQKTLDDLHKSFAILTQEEQKYANIFLHDVQSGNIIVEEGKTIRDYISQYLFEAKNDQIFRISKALGLDERKLRNMMDSGVNELNINEFGRFDDLYEISNSATKGIIFSKVTMSLISNHFRNSRKTFRSPNPLRISRAYNIIRKQMSESSFHAFSNKS
jgi:hypothetical protein